VWKITILRQKIIFFPIAEGGTKIVGVFRVKNHDFTPKNHIFSNFRGGGAGRVPPLDPPLKTNTYLHNSKESLIKDISEYRNYNTIGNDTFFYNILYEDWHFNLLLKHRK
jgi:hypothetical protein